MAAALLALSPRYRGAELIATGGMADVYVATDDSLERLVAIKVLSERFAGDPEIRNRFSREARIAARLSTEPNVVTIFGVEDVDGRPAIVMEFLPGGTLADRMSASRIAPAQALAWLEQAARALDAAHAAGVVHRDVKPANLMLAGDGDVRVTDFGIARIAGDVSLTSVGTILGTSGYMSPEQAVGGTATAASDRYGLAVVAFELLCGRRPYLAETFAAEASAHATAPIPAATRFDHSLPPSLDAVFERGLAKDPAQRFRSCGELAAALRWAFAESAATTVRIAPPVVATGVTVQRAGRRFPRALVLLAALGVLALLGLLTAGVMDRGSEATPPTTVVRTTTVAGKSVVRTVTVESQPAEPAAAKGPGPTAVGGQGQGAPTPAATDGAALNDQGFRLLKAGNAAAALPLLERAVSALQGSGSVTEAYALYNLALARFSTGNCDGVKDMLHESEHIQGRREEIKQLQQSVGSGCKHD
jgi:serine/threonine-protein kinase